MRVFLTGGSGFLGSRIAPAVSTAGYASWGLANSSAAEDEVTRNGLFPVSGDLTDPTSLALAVKKAKPEIVIHAAGERWTQRKNKLLRQVNVEGTRLLISSLRHLQIERFIYVGSLLVGQPNGTMSREDEMLTPTTAFGETIVECEMMLQEAADKHNFSLVILRPGYMYGAGGWLTQIVRELKRHVFSIPGDGENHWEVVHVDDVVQAVLRAAMAPKENLAPEVFNVVDDEPVSMNDFVAEVCYQMDREPPVHTPAALARLAQGKGVVDT
ncbi:MAG: NAD(P)-dependent oxidoreductase, partial [Myxococcales bacterium]|nr:NAD(P)-dependent oxidoreductase [Myxococcales bacterium]